MKVLCVDDHVIFRQGVRYTLSRPGTMLEFGEASTASETLERLSASRWDLVLLDVSLPDRCGLELLLDLRRLWPDTPVVVLTAHDDEEYAVRAMRNGAAAYVTKNTAPCDLLTAIARVREGGKYISPRVAERIAMTVATGPQQKPYERLSPREREILFLIGEGRSLKEIANMLNLSTKSVGTYRARILDKMNLSTNAQLVRYLVEHHLLP